MAERTRERARFAFALCWRERAPRPAPKVNLGVEAVLRQMRLVGLRAVGRVRPDQAGRVGLVPNRPQLGSIICCRIGDREAAHEPMSPVDADVVLVAKHRNGNVNAPLPRGLGNRLGAGALQRPAGVSVLLRQLLGLVLPALWDVALFDRLLLRVRVALTW